MVLPIRRRRLINTWATAKSSTSTPNSATVAPAKAIQSISRGQTTVWRFSPVQTTSAPISTNYRAATSANAQSCVANSGRTQLLRGTVGDEVPVTVALADIRQKLVRGVERLLRVRRAQQQVVVVMQINSSDRR